MTTSNSKTSTTTNWILEKYSRSRPSISSNSNDHEPSPSKKFKLNQSITSEIVEWDHYSQPKIHLSLEVITSSILNSNSTNSNNEIIHNSGHQIHQMNLRISHEPLPTSSRNHPQLTASTSNSSALISNTYDKPINSNSFHTLESLDLASFHSSPSILSCTPQDQLPLKAVYKGSVVGLRYIEINQLDLNQGRGRRSRIEFKRFQIKFNNKLDAEKFVNLLGKICPVKLAEISDGVNVKNKLKKDGSSEGSRMTNEVKSVVGNSKTNTSTISSPSASSSNITSSTIRQPSAYNRFPSPQSLPPPPNFIPPPPQLPVPTRLTSIFPNLTASLQPPASVLPIQNIQKILKENYNCKELSNLNEKEFENLLEEILFDDEFESLVLRIKGSLKSKMGL